MDMRSITSESIVLRGRDYSEADRVLVVLTREHGKLSVIAKSVRKPKSRLKACTQLFSHSRLNISRGRGSLGVVTQGETIDSLMGLREELTKIACASYIGEMVDIALPESRANEDVFVLTLAALKLLVHVDDPYVLLRFFDLRLLAVLGYRPQLDRCMACGRSSVGGEFLLSPARGGLICRSCLDNATARPVSGGTIAIMDKLLTWDLRQLFNLRINETTRQELDRAVFHYLDYYLNRSAKARDALYQYLQL